MLKFSEVNNMSVVVSDDENSDDSFSDLSQFSTQHDDTRDESKSDSFNLFKPTKPTNVVYNVSNRQVRCGI